jgi:aminoglycoside/choline kinase family phosphotransferase
MQFSTPSLWGCHTDESAGVVCLILEYLDGSMRVTESTEADAMVLAVRWIGQFHAAVAARRADNVFTFLMPYDKAYYQGWVQRTLQYAGRHTAHYQWLKVLFEQFDKVVKALLSAPPTIIHGEYYAQNILFRNGKIFPVDWESAAIGAGEIDLASLAEGWPEEIARRFESEYRQKRWPNGPPHDFERTLCAARIYLCLRWLGESPELTAADSFRFDRLHSACQQFGLIQGV